jgi:hypothetical protein
VLMNMNDCFWKRRSFYLKSSVCDRELLLHVLINQRLLSHSLNGPGMETPSWQILTYVLKCCTDSIVVSLCLSQLRITGCLCKFPYVVFGQTDVLSLLSPS